MPFTGPGTRSLTLYPVFFTNLVNQLCRYAGINSLRQLSSNLLLGLTLSNTTSDFLNRVGNPVRWFHSETTV